MILSTLREFITSKNLSAQIKTFRIMKIEGSLIFYNAGIEIGLFSLLAEPSSLEEIATKLHIKNMGLLASLLDMGCSLKEISCKNGKYKLKGSMAKAFVTSVPIRDLIRETVQYHAGIAQNIHTYLLKNISGDYLDRVGGLIAESSRLTEPLIKAFIYHNVKKAEKLSILEIGCGSGEYLRYYVDINSSSSGIAIDRDKSAVAIAQRRIKENGITANFTAVQDNIIKPVKIRGMEFDLVTSYSNIYYFSDDERLGLFNSVHKMLKENGRFMLATGMKSGGLSSCYYDLIFTATKGLYPLPEADGIVNDMRRCGFSRIEVVNILGKSFQGIVGYK